MQPATTRTVKTAQTCKELPWLAAMQLSAMEEPSRIARASDTFLGHLEVKTSSRSQDRRTKASAVRSASVSAPQPTVNLTAARARVLAA